MDALRIHGLSKIYPNRVEALRDLNLTVAPGSFVGLLGPNGAGKSTAVGILTGLIRKTAGKVSVMGYDLDLERDKARSCLGVVPQDFNFNVFEKVRDIIINQAGYYGLPRPLAILRCDSLLKELGLFDKRDQPARHLSGGMKRRLLLARGLVHSPKILLLDEPTAGIDVELRQLLWAFLERLNQSGITIILTTHYLDEAERLCDRLIFLNRGSIVADLPKKQVKQCFVSETVLLDMDQADFSLPTVAGFQAEWLPAEPVISLVRALNRPLSEYIKALDALGKSVFSVRNPSNRLEQLLISYTQNDNKREGER